RLVQRGRNRGLDRCGHRRFGMMIVGRSRGRGIVGVTGMIVVMMIVMRVRLLGVVRLVTVFVLVAVVMTLMVMMRGLGMSLALVRMSVIGGWRRPGVGVLDDLAPHALATVAAA